MGDIHDDLREVMGLLSCPCGRAAKFTNDTQRRVFYAECTDESCWIGPDAESREAAANKWNARRLTGNPSWDLAPDWASHLAMGKDGSWCWFEGKPEIVGFYWMPKGRFQRIWIEDWQESLEARP